MLCFACLTQGGLDARALPAGREGGRFLMSTTATTSTLAAAKRSRDVVEEGGIARRKQRRTQRAASSAGTGSGGGTSGRSGGAKGGGMAVYKDFAMPDLSLAGEDAVTIKVGREWMGRSNPKLRHRQLWGTDMYTDDSDIVAILVHTGYLYPPSAPSQVVPIVEASGALGALSALEPVVNCI